MKITLYAKKATTRTGKTFHKYLSKITNKNGEELSVSVHFKLTAGLPNPDTCPCVIEFDKKSASLSKKEKAYDVIDPVTGKEESRVFTDNQLWIASYTFLGEAEDHSMDDFED